MVKHSVYAEMGNSNGYGSLVGLGLSFALLVQLLGSAMAGNILALMGMTSHSHHIW